jgi:hypothetical protein
VDPPTELEPLEILCPACHGSDDGCASCTLGHVRVTRCPQRWLGGWPAEFVQFADLFKKGHGIAGPCLMDETQHFVDSYAFFRSECDRLNPDPFDM